MIKTDYEIKIGHNLLNDSGAWLRKVLDPQKSKIFVVSNPKIFSLYGEKLSKSFADNGFETFVWLMRDGEKFKNFHSLETLLKALSENQLTRTDAIVALGGGVVGDLSGFAAAVFLRGIKFLQIPTTILAMIDSSVGGKTGVNTTFGKNLIGAFHQPTGVLADVSTLQTLPLREITSGLCEAVKQGIIANRKLFFQTSEFLEKYPIQKIKQQFKNDNFLSDLENLIRAQVAFKSEIVAGDAGEDVARKDKKSRKILNFGHTLGHALEKITDYRYFKHGEAVGYGILFASDLSKKLKIIPADEFKCIKELLSRVGKLPPIPKISTNEIIEAIKFDKKSVNGTLQWILPEKIGKPLIVSDKDIPQKILKAAIDDLLSQN